MKTGAHHQSALMHEKPPFALRKQLQLPNGEDIVGVAQSLPTSDFLLTNTPV